VLICSTLGVLEDLRLCHFLRHVHQWNKKRMTIVMQKLLAMLQREYSKPPMKLKKDVSASSNSRQRHSAARKQSSLKWKLLILESGRELWLTLWRWIPSGAM
jgi:hypothetical protein